MANVKREMRQKNIVYRNGWALLFIATCLSTYYYSVASKKNVIALLDEQLSSLKVEKETLLQEREDLLLEINSQSDPGWIKLILMKRLGLVPEGQLKVYFHSGEG